MLLELFERMVFCNASKFAMFMKSPCRFIIFHFEQLCSKLKTKIYMDFFVAKVEHKSLFSEHCQVNIAMNTFLKYQVIMAKLQSYVGLQIINIPSLIKCLK